MIWNLLAYWLGFLFPTFYKRIQSHNLHHLYTADPVVIAMNHPNAFTDPIALSFVSYPMRLHYMARGDAFKPGLISWMLEKLGIVPIFRIQDAGIEGLKKNHLAYRRVNRLLARNAKVMVFAEGLCVQERRLRPLKKGVARMVFGAFQELDNDRLKVIPIGVNYTQPDKFRSKLLYVVGEPMMVRDYMATYEENSAKTMNSFMQDLEKRLKELVIHIADPAHDDLVFWIEKLRKKDMVREQGLPEKELYSELLVSQQITNQVSAWAEKDPDSLQRFKAEAQSYFSGLRRARIKDWLLHPSRQKSNNYWSLATRIFMLCIFSPVYLTGMAFNFPPLWVTDKITKKIVREREFFSSFAFGISMLVFPAFYSLWFVFFYFFSDNLPAALGLCVVAGICGWATLYIHPLVLRTIGLGRYLSRRRELATLRELRSSLLAALNKFCSPAA